MISDHLILKILDFMAVIHECYSNTTFANDRSVYAKDLATAMGWIVELRAGINNQIVKDKIFSSVTEKHFGDYWRQGDWGDKEANALKKLKDSI
ncbi:MAG: hypothetical protein ABIJ50_14075 [Pseudomonadota bacterium]